MAKKLTLTDKIKAAIIRSTGDPEFDFSKVSVFEASCFNTLPVNKGGLFKGARATELTLHEMAKFVNEEGFVPMHTMHAQSYELPVGRVFAADVHPDDNGVPTLHDLFYIGNDQKTATGASLADAIDDGSINEVSVGLVPRHLNCSQCGFDYLGADATSDNIYGHVCANDHEIGKDGTHLLMNGMGRWLEKSLVSLGAAKGTKIHSRTKALLGNEAYEKLAASGVSPDATTLFASHTIITPKPPEKKTMDEKELITLNATLTGQKAVAEHQVTTLTAEKATLTASLTTANTEIATLKTELAAAKSTDATKLAADLTAAQAAATTQLAFVRKEADRLAVAAGVTKLGDDATFEQLTASIEENRTKLGATYGGKAQDAGTGSGDSGRAASLKSNASFKVPR